MKSLAIKIKQLKQDRTGFTLTEIVSVLTITVMVMLLVYNIFQISQKSFLTGDNLLEISQNARILLDRLSRELRQTPEIATALPPDKEQIGFLPAAEIMFQDGHDAPEIIYLRYYLDQNQVYRQKKYFYFAAEPQTKVKWNAIDAFGQPPQEQLLEQKIVAEYVSQLQFYGQGLTMLEIYLDKNGSLSHLLSGVWGRNTRN